MRALTGTTDTVGHIARSIVILRGHRVLLDAELAALYGVTTRRLNEQVRRNRGRFPDDFVFELSKTEFQNLKSQFAISSWGGRDRRTLESPNDPYRVSNHDIQVGPRRVHSRRQRR